MFEIAISDIETSELVIKKWASKAIGLIDPECKNAIPTKENYLQVYFHDCDEAIHPDYYAISPEKEQIQQVLDFSKSFTSTDRILVHCHAGISRSSAVAISVLTQHGLEPFEAFGHVQRICKDMYPNKLILRYADELLGLNNRLVDYHEMWLSCFNTKN